MKLSHVVAGLSAMSVFEYTCAYPGMKNTVRELQDRVRTLEKRLPHKLSLHRRLPQTTENENEEEDDANEVEVVDPNDDGSLPPVLIGDLANPPPGGLTPIGKTIAGILLQTESGEDSKSTYKIPGKLTSKECKADVCCKWAYVSRDLTTLFVGPTGRCNRYARAAVRLGFHDAGTWQEGLDYGGADGSIVLAKSEIKRKDNNGLADIVKLMPEYASKYGVGIADLIQFAAKHAVVTCPLGPRIRTFVGRKDSSKASQEGLLPGVNDSADKLIDLFQKKTISPHDLVALLGAHTTSEQFFVDPKRAGAPQDGTPGVWDTLFYNQTLGLGPLPKQVLRFPSDVVLTSDPRTKSEWLAFSSGKDAQSHWNEDYAYSYIRLSLLGVNVINKMTECTKVLPLPGKAVKDTGKLLVNQ
ncbi:heme peroxidase [Pyrenochaeta sp. MPI-SDFR-AT-0127]|nr:heme peroxidase [Pyrenochaeta sp. MPI-SDFR-AT-0127]